MDTRRGRPLKFDEVRALGAALAVFWLGGYASSTVDDLTEAIAINRPSLYVAFGAKEDLYELAVRRYIDTYGRRYLDALTQGGSFTKDLVGFYGRLIETISAEDGRGCPVACTLPAEAMNSERIRMLLAKLLKEIDDVATARVKTAIEAGETDPDGDAPIVAKLIVDTLLGLSVRARSGANRRELNAIARTFVTLIAA